MGLHQTLRRLETRLKKKQAAEAEKKAKQALKNKIETIKKQLAK